MTLCRVAVGDPVPVGMFTYVQMYMSTEINLKCCFSDTVQHDFDGGSLIGLEFDGWAGLLSKQAPEITNTFPHSQVFPCGAQKSNSGSPVWAATT